MATKTAPKRMNRPFTDTVPDWPTAVKQIYNSGLVISIDNDVWLYRRCPMGPVTSAITEDDALRVGQPIFDALVEIEGLTRTAVKSRRFSKNNYREFHMLLVNVPQRYVPDDDQPLKGFLSRQFSDAITYRRELLVGVKLRNSAFRSGWRQSIEVFYEALTLQNVGVQLPEYAADYRRVDAALTRAGLMVATRAEMHLADSWWNLGANPDVPYLVHSDHLHMFTSTTSMTEAARLEKADVDCREPEWSDLHNHHSLGFVGFDTFNYNWRDVKSLETNFVVELVRQGAMAVSFRGKVEPTAITRNELRTGRRRIRADITEAQAQGAMDRQEQEDKQAAIEQMESLYSSATLHLPTVIDASIVAALNGSLDGSYDVAGLTRTVKLSNLVERQEKALAEMMMGSQVRCNPLLRDLPATAMAFTGAPDLAVCGDTTGALLGFTEHDKQPVYISNDAASVGDALPIFLVAGATGSGKSLSMLNMAYQWAQAGVSQVVVDPKLGSDHSATVLAAGGQVATLDDLTKSDGILDPLRFTQNKLAGLEVAGSILVQVGPWDRPARQFETELMVALAYGVQEGATCIGQALKLAQDAGKASEELVKPVLDLANVSPLFGAIVGRDPQTKGLSVADGITLIMVGNTNLELPPMGQEPSSIQQRISVALVRMLVFGSAMALTGRRGVLHFDEAWIATLAGPEELNRLGRLARSQGVLPVLYTQRVTDVVKIGLAGYISRGLIMHLKDESEARAACQLFKLEETPERINRITTSERSGGSSESKEGALNWGSFKALFKTDPLDSTKRINVRGSVGLHVDLHGRAVPVVQDLPPEFLEMVSTNPEDIRRRTERMAALEASRQAALEHHDLPGSDSEADADGLAIDDVFNLS